MSPARMHRREDDREALPRVKGEPHDLSPSLPGRHARRIDRRPPAAHRRDPAAFQGACRRPVAGRAAGDDPGASRYWATDYDWRACEARLNALPQFTTEIDGV